MPDGNYYGYRYKARLSYKGQKLKANLCIDQANLFSINIDK